MRILVYFFFILSISFSLHGDDLSQLQRELNNLSGVKRLPILLKIVKHGQSLKGIKLVKYGKEIVSISKNKHDSHIELIGLKTMGFGYERMEKPIKSLEIYSKILNLSKFINDKKTEALTSIEIGNLLYFYDYNYKKAIKLYKNALIIFRKTNNVFGKAKLQNNIAEILIKLGDYKTAMKLYTLSLKNIESLGKSKELSKFIVLGNIAMVTCLMGNLNIAEKYIKKYDLVLKKSNYPRYKVKSLLLKSELFLQKNNYTAALAMIDKAYLLQEKFSKNLSLLDGNGVKMKLIQHKLKILLKTNQLKDMNALIKKIENMLKETPNSYTLSKILLIRSKYYYKSNKLELAVETGIKCATLSKKYNFYERLLQIYSKLSEWYAELNKPRLSLKYIKAKTNIEKKKINSRIQADIMSIILNYEQNKTSNEVGRLKKLNLQTVLLSISLIMLIIAIFILFFKKYRRKHIEHLKELEKKHRKTFVDLQKKIDSYKTKEIKKDMSLEKAKNIMRRIIETLTKDKLYLNSNLTLDTLSDQMNINHYYLSQAIGSSWNGNFIDLVNTYRVKEAKEFLSNPKFAHMNIIDIGFKVGFNSKSTFNRVFKSKISITPKEYRQINLE